MSAYYNENDPRAAAWLRELIKAGHIAPGDVDERSITEIHPNDLRPYTQCHFFAGIGGWSYALRLAGVPDDTRVWTGSCPCQPFSAAGKQLGATDERHLWPAFSALIGKCSPAIVFGEQVASKLGREWLSGVFADLEGMGYAVAGADLCAAGVSAPHIRQRLWWVANALGAECTGRAEGGRGQAHVFHVADGSAARGVADATDVRCSEHGEESGRRIEARTCDAAERGCAGGLGDAAGQRSLPRTYRGIRSGEESSGARDGEPERSGCWGAFDILPCRDGKARRVEAGTFPLAHGVSGRVGLLRGYGNAIVPQVAAEFIRAAFEAFEQPTNN